MLYNLQNHPTFHSEERLINLARGRECFVDLSTYIVSLQTRYLTIIYYIFYLFFNRFNLLQRIMVEKKGIKEILNYCFRSFYYTYRPASLEKQKQAANNLIIICQIRSKLNISYCIKVYVAFFCRPRLWK